MRDVPEQPAALKLQPSFLEYKPILNWSKFDKTSSSQPVIQVMFVQTACLLECYGITQCKLHSIQRVSACMGQSWLLIAVQA